MRQRLATGFVLSSAWSHVHIFAPISWVKTVARENGLMRRASVPPLNLVMRTLISRLMHDPTQPMAIRLLQLLCVLNSIEYCFEGY